ncbi:hypothetical protein D3D02_17975, partial [Halobellus sp. Atlit-38R]
MREFPRSRAGTVAGGAPAPAGASATAAREHDYIRAGTGRRHESLARRDPARPLLKTRHPRRRGSG